MLVKCNESLKFVALAPLAGDNEWNQWTVGSHWEQIHNIVDVQRNNIINIFE